MKRTFCLHALTVAGAALCLGWATPSRAQTQTPKPKPAAQAPSPETAPAKAAPAPKMWGDKNYNPAFFDLKPAVPQALEKERGAVRVFSPVAGRLAHAFYLYRPDRKLADDNVGYSAFDSYLALHELHADKTQADTLTFPTKMPPIVPGQHTGYAQGQIWYPHFSPDGRYLLFKYGKPTDPEGWNILYILDTQTQKMQRVPRAASVPSRLQLSYEHISWSPDGKYLACVLGGNRYGEVNVAHGPDTAYIGPMTLYIVEWQTGKWYEVARNDTLRGPFRWAAPHTLVYSLMPTPEPVPRAGAKPQVPTERPNIYQYSLETHTSQIVMHDGFLPTPSPSGKWVAFFGAENAAAGALSLRSDWTETPSNSSLIVAPLPALPKDAVRPGFLSKAPWEDKQRIVVNNEEHVYPQVFWLPDEKHLVTLKQTQWGEMEVATKKKEAIYQAEVRLWDLTDALAGKGMPRFKVIATLPIRDFQITPRSPVDGNYRGLRVSSDGKTFYVATQAFTGMDPLNNILYLRETTLKAVNLQTGQVISIAQTVGDVGIDWLEKPDSAMTSN